MKLTNIQVLLIGVFLLIIAIITTILMFMTVLRGPEIPWPILIVGGMLPPLWYITLRLEKDLEEAKK